MACGLPSHALGCCGTPSPALDTLRLLPEPRFTCSWILPWRFDASTGLGAPTPPSASAHGELHLFLHAVRQTLNLIGSANHIQRERILACLVYLFLEVGGQFEQLCGIVGNLFLSLGVGGGKVLLFRLLFAHLHLVVCVRRPVGCRKQYARGSWRWVVQGCLRVALRPRRQRH